jgi:hypothetical protein
MSLLLPIYHCMLQTKIAFKIKEKQFSVLQCIFERKVHVSIECKIQKLFFYKNYKDFNSGTLAHCTLFPKAKLEFFSFSFYSIDWN